MLVRMQIHTIVVGGGPVPSLVVLRSQRDKNGQAQDLPIQIGPVEATAISVGLSGDNPKRPITHDLLWNTIKRLGAEIVAVSITDVRGTTFFANVVLVNSAGERLSIDCRPSDAIALAVRAHVPICAEENVLKSAALPDFTGVERNEKKQELERFHEFVENLSAEDFATD